MLLLVTRRVKAFGNVYFVLRVLMLSGRIHRLAYWLWIGPRAGVRVST